MLLSGRSATTCRIGATRIPSDGIGQSGKKPSSASPWSARPARAGYGSGYMSENRTEESTSIARMDDSLNIHPRRDERNPAETGRRGPLRGPTVVERRYPGRRAERARRPGSTGPDPTAPTATLLPAGSSTVTGMAFQTGTGLGATRGELPTDVAAAVGAFGRSAAARKTPTQAPSNPGLVRRLREAEADVPPV